MNLTAGTSLHNGKYVLNQAIGQAEFGITYRATSTQTDQPVVIKTLNQELQHHADFAKVRQRFLEEAKQLQQCQHPNLAKTLDVFEESGLPFLVTDHVTGQTLADLVKSNGSFAESQATHAIRQVGAALRVLHQHQLLHRGVKPKNLIQCDRTGFVILTDFGIAQGVGSIQESKHLSAGYAALEQYYPKVGFTPATDVYGLAATCFYLLTGTPPPAAPMRDRMPAPNLRQSQPNISSALEQAILQGMAIEATLRPQSIEAWLALLPNPFANPSMNGASQNGNNGAGNNGAVSTSAPTVITALQSNSSTVTTTHPTAVVAPPSVTTPAKVPTVAAIPTTSTGVQLTSSPWSNQWLRVLGVASVVAGLVGVGSGFTMRLSGGSSPGSTLFNTEQNFPPSDKWPGTPLTDNVEPVAAPVDRTPLQAEPEPEPITRQAEPIAPAPQPQPTEEFPSEPEPPVVDPSLSTPTPNPSIAPIAPIDPDPVVDPPAAIAPSPAPAAPPQAPAPQPSSQPQTPSAQSGAN